MNDSAPYAQLAVRFAEALVARDFSGAHARFSAPLRRTLGPKRLRRHYDAKIPPGDGPPPTVQFITTLEAWPDRRANDLGWAHVAIAGEAVSGAVIVIDELQAGRAEIRHGVWGRP